MSQSLAPATRRSLPPACAGLFAGSPRPSVAVKQMMLAARKGQQIIQRVVAGVPVDVVNVHPLLDWAMCLPPDKSMLCDIALLVGPRMLRHPKVNVPVCPNDSSALPDSPTQGAALPLRGPSSVRSARAHFHASEAQHPGDGGSATSDLAGDRCASQAALIESLQVLSRGHIRNRLRRAKSSRDPRQGATAASAEVVRAASGAESQPARWANSVFQDTPRHDPLPPFFLGIIR